jgi:hypothetical protein
VPPRKRPEHVDYGDIDSAGTLWTTVLWWTNVLWTSVLTTVLWWAAALRTTVLRLLTVVAPTATDAEKGEACEQNPNHPANRNPLSMEGPDLDRA